MDFAYPVVHRDPPEVYFAENGEVLSEVLVRELIALTPSQHFAPLALRRLRKALLDRQWGTAMEIWIENTNTGVDVFDSCDVFWTKESVARDSYDLAMKKSPLFQGSNA
jgi:hypothetical protein